MNKRTVEKVKIAIALISLLAMLVAVGHVETHYTRKDCVVIDTQGYVVVVEDKGGHVWKYVAEDEVPRVGDVVDLRMHTEHTDTDITDDTIVGVREH